MHDFDIVLTKTFSERSNLSLSTLKTESESAKRSATCRHCKQTFKFKELLRKHKREQHAKKSVISSSLLSHALNSVCEAEKKSAINEVIALLASLQISAQKPQKIDVQKHSIVNSLLLIDTVKSTYEVAEKSAIASTAKASKITSAQKEIELTRQEVQKVEILKAKQRLNELRERRAQRETKQETQKQAEMIEQEAQKKAARFMSVSSKRSSLQLRVSNSASKSMKSASIQRIVCARTICKRCNQIFNFNNKLHEHIRQHHARKSVISKSSDLRAPALESTYKIAEKSTITCPSASHASPTPSATPQSQIFSTKMSSRSVSPSDSHLSIATLKITSKSLEKLPVNCQLTSSLSSSRTSVRKHQESNIQKSYLTMKNLSRMFDEKFRSFDLQQHQNRPSSSRKFDIRRSHSIKSHLTIENLFQMFDEKFRRKSLFQNQKNVSSREFSSEQSRITVYFKPTVNQKISISQTSKSSKSKTSKQYLPAESIRTVFSKELSEKSLNLSYKKSDVSDESSVETSFFIFILLRLLSIFLLAFAFVSTISAARMNCINVYEQVISIIDRVIQ